MTFRQAVERTAAVEGRYREGLRGIRNVDRQRIHCSNPRMLTGSIDLDEALRVRNPNDPRWDYGIGVRVGARSDIVIWAEVHPATSLHVDEVLTKLRWLRERTGDSAPAFVELGQHFCWVATGSIAFRRGSPQEKRIAQQGLRFPVKRLNLDSYAA
jgi:hypothetical protein